MFTANGCLRPSLSVAIATGNRIAREVDRNKFKNDHEQKMKTPVFRFSNSTQARFFCHYSSAMTITQAVLNSSRFSVCPENLQFSIRF